MPAQLSRTGNLLATVCSHLLVSMPVMAWKP